MVLKDLESAITQLPADELAACAALEVYWADACDQQIEADIKSGKLDESGRQADADFEAGRCKPL